MMEMKTARSHRKSQFSHALPMQLCLTHADRMCSIKPESPAPKQYPKDDVKAAATEAVMASGVANVDRGRSLSSNSADPLTVDDRAEATGLIAIPDFGSLGRTGSNEKSNRVTFGSAKQGRKRGRISCTQEE